MVLNLHQKGTDATKISRQLNISRSTVYKVLEDETVIDGKRAASTVW
ncbi:transposase [Serratia sp. Leaf51]|nr:transposase [Serratia sp. Leaf51]